MLNLLKIYCKFTVNLSKNIVNLQEYMKILRI